MPAAHSVKTVSTWPEIADNIQTLEEYKHSESQELRDYFRRLIKRGTCFIVSRVNGSLVFSPSRFVGYLKNSMEIHENNHMKDGRVTNPVIENITGCKFQIDSALEHSYKQYCLSLGIKPNASGNFGVDRKYISYGSFNLQNTLIDDISEILNAKTIQNTERMSLIAARIGQGYFRDLLISLWKGCSVTGCKEVSILKASHIKPWKVSDNNERLNVYNGLLLLPNLDALFDRGMISFQQDGRIIISSKLSNESLETIGIKKSFRIKVYPEMSEFLKYHREFVFWK